MNRPSLRPRTALGYTVVEILIALTLLAVGAGGVIAMEKITAISNRDARSLVVANQIARAWIDRLRTDAVAWNHPSNEQDPSTDRETDTLWLRSVAGTWVRPVDDARGSPTADAFGNDVRDDDPDFTTRASYCTNIRLTWMTDAALAGALVIRADVRVFWLRQGGGGNVENDKPFCDPKMATDSVTGATSRYHFVHLTSGIPQNAAQ